MRLLLLLKMAKTTTTTQYGKPCKARREKHWAGASLGSEFENDDSIKVRTLCSCAVIALFSYY